MTQIRLATIDDLSRLVEVGDKLFDHAIKVDRTKEFFDDKHHHLFIALDGENVVGMASGLTYVHPDKDLSLFINEVAVLDDYQNLGIGRQLTQALLKYAKQLGCIECWLATEESNLPARRAYLAAGGTEDSEKAVVFTFNGSDFHA